MEEEFETEEIMTDEVSSLENIKEVDPVVDFVEEQFLRAKDARQVDEARWLKAYQNFRGVYGPETQFTDSEKSRIFVKVTKTKVLAAASQINEILFGNGKFPLSIDPTSLPEGVVESVHLDPNAPPEQPTNPFGTRDGPPLPPGATIHDLGKLPKKLEPVRDKLVEGEGTTPTAVTFHPAMQKAKKMEKKIHDQLEEGGASKHLRRVSFEMPLFGTGILKGPYATDKEYPNWEDGMYKPTVKTIPSVASVSIWNFYPDPDASNMDECEFAIERHKLSRTELYKLRSRPHFSKEAINAAIEEGPNYQRETWEDVMEEGNSGGLSIERYEALEYWGFLSRELLQEKGIHIPRAYKNNDYINVNIWICNGEILRLVLNPFKPEKIPYHAAPYELNPYSFFGVGVAENMEDTQLLMNGFMRLAVDNAALSGNLIFDVDEDALEPGQDLEIYPGKVFRRRGGVVGQAVYGTKFPNVSQENMVMFDKARVLADESTGLPSYSYGQTGIMGVGRTASGISMLMDAANSSIRSVIKNIDDYLLGPLGKALFAFNMQFDYDEEIKGDLEVNARGTESLMAGEVKSQRLMQFLGVVANPILAPFAKLDVIVREIAKSLDLDPDKVANSLPDAALQAELLKQFSPPSGGQGSPEAPAGAQAGDTNGSGGGTIGTGSVPAPGSPGFSGTPRPQGNAQ